MNRDSPEILLSGKHYRAVQRAAFAPETFRDSKASQWMWGMFADAYLSIGECSGKFETASKSFSAFGQVISELKAKNGLTADWVIIDDPQFRDSTSDQPGEGVDRSPDGNDNPGDDDQLGE